MYAYAFVGYFDNKTEAFLKNIWIDLSEKDITQYGIETEGKRPHITIADYYDIDEERLIAALQEFYKDEQEVDINLSTIGTFIKTGTLFLAPTISEELRSLHNRHHERFQEFNGDVVSFYSPGKWTPHCTVASRLSDGDMMKAFAYCRESIDKLSCTLKEVGLIQIQMDEEGRAVKDTMIFSKILK